jgi:phosphoesterase RecJ-like protein
MSGTAIEQACTAIDAAPALALACHVHPDGDALGSMLALRHMAAANGKDVVFSWGEPFIVAPHYRFLPGVDLAVPPERFPHEPDVMVALDCASLERLGTLAPNAKAAGELVVLDHHPDSEDFGSVNVVDSAAAATAVLVRRVAERLGWSLTPDAALCLYVGLLTDTGRFQYPNTTDRVFHLAEELAAYGLPIADVTRELFEKHRFAYVQLAAMCLARAQLDPNRRFVAAWITRDDLDRYGVAFEETEGFIDLVRRTAEADVSCVLRESPGEGLRVSLRSVARTDVGSLAGALGGGGHAYMAGFQTDLPIADTITRIKQHLPA